MNPQRPTDVTPIGDWNRLLDGRVAVVTGGGDGIGGAISTLFAEHGALVEIAEVDEDRAARTRQAIDDAGGTARTHIVDVTVARRRRPARHRRPLRARPRRHPGQQRRGLPSLGPLRELDARFVEGHVRHQPVAHPGHDPCLPRHHDGRRAGLDRQRPLGRRTARLPRGPGVRGDEGGGRAFHHLPGRRRGAVRESGSTGSGPTSPSRPRWTTSRAEGTTTTCGRRGRRWAGWAGPRTRPGWPSSWPPTWPATSPVTTSRSTAGPGPVEGGSSPPGPDDSSTGHGRSDAGNGVSRPAGHFVGNCLSTSGGT